MRSRPCSIAAPGSAMSARREQEAAAHPENTREKTNSRAESEQDEDVDRHLGDRQVDVHDPGGAGFVSLFHALLFGAACGRNPTVRSCSAVYRASPTKWW